MVYRDILKSYATANIPIEYKETLTTIEKKPKQTVFSISHAIYDILKPLAKF